MILHWFEKNAIKKMRVKVALEFNYFCVIIVKKNIGIKMF